MIKFFTKLKIFLNPKLIVIRISYVLKRILYDIYFLFFKDKYKYKIIFLAGLPMSATTKLKNMCGRVNGYFSRRNPTPEKIWLNQDISNETFKYCPSWSYSLLKTHLNPKDENIKIIKNNNVKKVIVSYRDLRDVVVARYYRLLSFPKKENEPNFLKKNLQYKNINKSDAINDCIDIVATEYTRWIFGWFDIASKYKNFVMFCKFENLISEPKKEFKKINRRATAIIFSAMMVGLKLGLSIGGALVTKILDFYEISLEDVEINKIVEDTEGKKNMHINFGEAKILPWALSSNFRSGKIGNWKKEFDSSNIDRFKKTCGKSLIRLGYEKDMNW